VATNKTYRNKFRLYENRLLRLLVSYLAVAVVALALSWVANPAFLDVYRLRPTT
jgi:hypothetical protein